MKFKKIERLENCLAELNAFREASRGDPTAMLELIDKIQNDLREAQIALRYTTDHVQEITTQMIEYRLTGTQTRHRNYALTMENDELKERIQSLELRLSAM